MRRFFYISFASDAGFLGATVVRAYSVAHAILEATRLGLNPGGEAAIMAVPDDNEPMAKKFLNRLVGKAEVEAEGAHRLEDCSDEVREQFEENAAIVCEEDNLKKVKPA